MKYKLDIVKPEYYSSIMNYKMETLEAKSKFCGCNCLEQYDDIEKWHFNNLLFESEATVPPGYSIAYQYLYIEDDEVVGMLNFRPKANEHPYLSKYGGHIGYSIKPSKRNKGIGSMMLKDFIELCKKEYDVDKLLILCHSYNEGSRRVILNNGGIFESNILYPPENEILERYWIKVK